MYSGSMPTPKDGDLYVNEHGGRQSYVSARLDLIPPENLLLLGQCLGFGAKKYGEGNWHQIPQNENLNHALVHIVKWLNGDRSEPHLVNVLARVNFALWHAIQDGQQPTEYIHPDMKKAQENANNGQPTEEEIEAANKDWFIRRLRFICNLTEEQAEEAYNSSKTVEYISPGQTDRM